jgi:hypothetical protein
LVGTLLAVGNWGCVVVLIRGKRAPSLAPLLGGLFLLLAIAATPISSIRRWAPLGLLIDPWLIATIVGIDGNWIKGRRRRA